MVKKIAEYVSLIIIVLLIDLLVKNIYVENSIYQLEVVNYVFDIKDFIRIAVFMSIIIYFIWSQYDRMSVFTKVIFDVFIAASLIYLIDRIFQRKITYIVIKSIGIKITFAALLFSIGWICEIVALLFNSIYMDKKIKKLKQKSIDSLK